MLTIALPARWGARSCLLVALAGAVGLGLAERFGPWGWTILLTPASLVALSLKSERRWLVGAWLLFVSGALLPRWLGRSPSPVLWVESIGIALDLAVMFGVVRLLTDRGNAFVIAVGAGCVRVACELVWSLTPFGDSFAWGLYLIDATPIAQASHVGGLAMFSFGVVFSAAALALIVLDPERRAVHRTFALSVAGLSLVLALGVGRLGRTASEVVRVAAVSSAEGGEARLTALTTAAAGERAQVVVWPGDAVTWPSETIDEFWGRLSELARSLDIWLVVGVVHPESPAPLAALLTPRTVEMVRATYQAGHLRPLAAGAAGAEPPDALLSRFGGVAALLAYDVWFSGPARTATVSGATVVAEPFVYDPAVERRALALSRARAVENAIVLVRCSRAGSSAIIDPFGRVVAEADSRQEPDHALAADVGVVHGGLMLARLRANVPWLCLPMLALCLLLAVRSRPVPVRFDWLGLPGPVDGELSTRVRAAEGSG